MQVLISPCRRCSRCQLVCHSQHQSGPPRSGTDMSGCLQWSVCADAKRDQVLIYLYKISGIYNYFCKNWKWSAAGHFSFKMKKEFHSDVSVVHHSVVQFVHWINHSPPSRHYPGQQSWWGFYQHSGASVSPEVNRSHCYLKHITKNLTAYQTRIKLSVFTGNHSSDCSQTVNIRCPHEEGQTTDIMI